MVLKCGITALADRFRFLAHSGYANQRVFTIQKLIQFVTTPIRNLNGFAVG